MWCSACHADVAAELSSDNRHFRCARCQTELGLAAGSIERPTTFARSLDTERNARELLARWSTQNMLESATTVSHEGALVDGRTSGTGSPMMTNRSGHRFDSTHPSIPSPAPAMAEAAASMNSSRTEPTEARKPRRKKAPRPRIAEQSMNDLPTAASLHDEIVRKAIEQPKPPATNWTILAGQLCAYGGVGLLTCGTVLVLSGYFGGPANYAPTGWLVAAVGQMLLFLGVITLVSGGMEQTVDEVAWRIDHLAERIIHLEHMIEVRDARERRRLRDRRQLESQDRSDAA